ncbi:acyltransferase [Photobacterium sp. GJ3]|uniref:acyltransferase family protein n=1 Tax=Photobacterium sp. GJ3 TaxID=2829502 RepID=UPI001B8B8FD6|nr:acyltransferase [Photobacterium sp. GJ3]QUJ66499.1 acyltransferase [Photobacterium sp. GJ3]
MASKQRLTELDALRGLAALAVVLYHYFYRYDALYGHPGLAVDWAYAGRFGVHLFFIISGFVIFWTLNRVERPVDFVVSRVSRLYPVYWFAVALTYCVVSVMGLPGREVDSVAALANLLMCHQWFGIPHVDGVYWTLTVELMFYVWMFGLFLIGLLKQAERIFMVVMVADVVVRLSGSDMPPFLSQLLILPYLPMFTAGICFYKIWQGLQTNAAYRTLLMCAVILGINYSVSQFALMLLIMLSFWLAVIRGALGFLTWRPLVFLGTISYSLYLVHQNLGYVVIQLFYGQDWPAVAGMLTAMVLSLLIASLMTYGIEQPVLRWVRQRYPRRPFSPQTSER